MLVAKDDDYGDDEEEVDKSIIWFHAFMMFAAIYMAMMMTNWGSAVTGGGSLNNSWATVWIKFCAQWVTISLYLWSLIAPMVCTSREFNY